MRIIAGTLGGRRFKGPPGDRTRPTSDRVREGIFSALESRGLIEGVVALDLFAGTGAMAFEALSRGATFAVCAELDARVSRTLVESARELGVADRVKACALDLFSGRRVADRVRELLPSPAGLVFVDPPYAEIAKMPAMLSLLFDSQVIAESAVIVVEHATRAPVAAQDPLASLASYRYGDTSVTLLQRPPHSNV